MAEFPVNAELVAVAWLKGIEGVPTEQVATTLPRPNDEFAKHGFVQVTIVGGAPGIHSPMHSPRVQVDCWAYNKDSQKVPWGKAATLASYIVRATESGDARHVVTPSQYEDAFVHSVYVATDPRRVPDDDAYAHYSMDLRLNWTRRT